MDLTNPLLGLRLMNILNPQGVQGQDQNQPLPVPQDSGAITQQTIPDSYNNTPDLNKTFPIQSQMTDQYRQAIQQMPQRQDFKPGRLRNIAASLAGFGGLGYYEMGPGGVGGFHGGNPEAALNLSQAIRYQPYNQAMEDWKTREESLKQAASNEQAQNVNSRMAAYNAGMLGVRNDANDINKNYKEASVTARNRNIDARYAAIAANSASLSGKSAIDDNEELVLFRKDGTPVPTGMTPEEFGAIDRRNQGAMARVITQQEGATTRKNKDIAAKTGGEGKASVKMIGSAEQKKAAMNRVDNILSANPWAKEAVSYDKASGFLTIDDPVATTFWGGSKYTPEQQRVLQQIQVAAQIEEPKSVTTEGQPVQVQPVQQSSQKPVQQKQQAPIIPPPPGIKPGELYFDGTKLVKFGG
jgi:hypothetical protein